MTSVFWTELPAVVKSTATTAKLVLAGLLVAIVTWSWPAEPSHAAAVAHLVQFGVLVVVVIFWSAVTAKLMEPSEDEKRLRMQRLSQAIAKAGETVGISLNWYTAVSHLIYTVATCALVAVSAFVGYSIVHGYPASAAESWIDSIHAVWRHALKTYSHKELFIGLWLFHQAAFWGSSFVFAILDFSRPKLLVPFKIQEEVKISVWRYTQAVLLAIVNNGLTLLLMLGVWEIFPIVSPNSFREELPTLVDLIVGLTVSAAGSEIWFYFGHRLMHTNFFWYHVHWIHHTWPAPVACSAVFAHPFEHLVVNFPTVIFGPFLLGAHMFVWYGWAAFATLQTCQGHSGWHLPFMGSSEGHNYHHVQGRDNLGVIQVLDTFLHTNKNYLAAFQSTLDKTYYGPDYPVDKVLADPNLTKGGRIRPAAEAETVA